MKKAFWFDIHELKSAEASRLRKKKQLLQQRFDIPNDLLPGSLSMSQVRCGKATCRCMSEPGHVSWSLTFMVDGKKHVEHIPLEAVEEVRKRVEAGREFQDAVRDVLAANAQLLVLTRRQRRQLKKKRH
jgi:hypothetical protein